MAIKTTEKAFAALLEQRGIYSQLEVSKSVVSIWKKDIRENGKFPTDKTMQHYLKKAGAKIIKQEVIWQLKETA